MIDQAFVPILRNIEGAEAGAIILHIRLTVNAGADYFLVGMTISGWQPAEAGHIAIAVVVGQQPAEKIEGALSKIT